MVNNLRKFLLKNTADQANSVSGEEDKDGSQEKQLKIIGITGKRGKTITAHLVNHVLTEAGLSTALLSTNGYSIGEEIRGSNYNADTIKSTQLQNLISRSKADGIEILILEMTKQNLEKGVYDGIALADGIITNVDSYKSNEDSEDQDRNYRAFLRFAHLLQSNSHLFLNEEDSQFVNYLHHKGYEFPQSINVFVVGPNLAGNTNYYLNGIEFDFEGIRFRSSLVGSFAINNILSTVMLTRLYTDLSTIHSAVGSFEEPHGRFHLFEEAGRYVALDYAHSAKDLSEALKYLNITKPTSSKIITVLGNHSDFKDFRDEIGAPVAKLSSGVILAPIDQERERTHSVNSAIFDALDLDYAYLLERFEDPDALGKTNMQDLLGDLIEVRERGEIPFVSFDYDDYSGRLDAIRLALEHADEGDIVYIPGKGHETSITFGDTEYEWSDYEAVRMAVKELGLG